MKRGPGFEVWNPYNAQHCVGFEEVEEELVEEPFTLGHIHCCHNAVPEEIIWQQKIAEEMLDLGSIAYFQEEEEYYNAAEFMLQDSFNNHTAQRDGELGNTDDDGRITERGREYFRRISLQIRKEDPYDNGDPLPPQQKKTLIVDLTGDDIEFFYDVV